jgi:hypothetical protein
MKFALGTTPDRSARVRYVLIRFRDSDPGATMVQRLREKFFPKAPVTEDRRRRRIGPWPCDDIVGASRL